MSNPLIAIVGRPNVGKSTFFNRLVRQRIAIVEDLAGTTRDRLYANFEVWGRVCTLIDTGGFDPLDKEGYTPAILEQSQLAIDEADVIIFLTDGREEPTTLDYEVAAVLRRTQKPVILAANKVDNPRMPLSNLYALHLGEPRPVSAASGNGVAELLEAIEELLPPAEVEPAPDADVRRVAVVGRPNVGKSALTNLIVGYERSIVSPEAGTTRDAIDTHIDWKGQAVTLIDTAGMRRKARVRAQESSLEYHMVLRSLRAMDRSEVAIVLCDSGGIAEQDTKIAGYAHEAGKAVLVAINKWDLIEPDFSGTGKPSMAQRDYQGMIDRYLPFVSYAPVHFISALTGAGVPQMLDDALSIAASAHERVSTAALNDVLRRAVGDHPAPSVKGRQVKIRYATQAECSPPTIVIFTNQPDLVHFSYLRYLENCIRAKFPFRGVPLKIELRKSGEDDGLHSRVPRRENSRRQPSSGSTTARTATPGPQASTKPSAPSSRRSAGARSARSQSRQGRSS